jgi:hypothetical protein
VLVPTGIVIAGVGIVVFATELVDRTSPWAGWPASGCSP